MRRPPLSILAVFVILSSSLVVRADVKLPAFFSDHMVLQREGKAPVWGTAAPDEKISVRFRDQERQATAGSDGKWRVEFIGLKAGGPDELTVAGKNSITLKDVLVGEVWVGSGQSNMAGLVRSYTEKDPVLAKMAAQAHPQIRGAGANQSWTVATPENNSKFSALLFAFAVRLHEELDVPVGMMLGAVGGTPSGAWLSESALANDEPSQKQAAEYAKDYPKLLKDFDERLLPAWQKTADADKSAGKKVGRKPEPPAKPGALRTQAAGYLYKNHILPFVGYGIRGVLWDQGENGTAVGGVDQYTLMGALFRGWRTEWGQGDFPFIYVQKPSGGGCAWDPSNPVTSQAQPFSALPAAPPAFPNVEYVERHVRIMNHPNVGMAISSDLGAGIHPINKSGYGSRAATVALGMTYHKPVEYYGPIYASHAVAGNQIRIKFTHVGRGLAHRHGEKLQGFAIAGENKVFRWAEATIDGDEVVVSSSDVTKPVAVRYAWALQRTWANLFNQDGLPAVPFRTDKW